MQIVVQHFPPKRVVIVFDIVGAINFYVGNKAPSLIGYFGLVFYLFDIENVV